MTNNLINEMRNEILNRFDYIGKFDGVKFLLSIYGQRVTAGDCVKAWQLAYNN